MTRLVYPITLIVAVVILSGCAASNSTPQIKTPTPHSAVLTVSSATSCTLLFGPHFQGGPMQKGVDIITRFAATPDGSTVTLDELKANVASLRDARQTANETMRPLIDVELAPFTQLVATYEGGPNKGLDLSDWKAAGIELSQKCRG